MKRTPQDYIDYDPFAGDMDPLPVRCRTVKVVQVRKPQRCGGNDGTDAHAIERGKHARFESGIVDGEWCRFWYCCDCLDRLFDAREADRG